MKPAKKLLILALITLGLALLFLLWGLTAKNWDYNLPRRLIKLSAIGLTGSAIAYSTVMFQTVVGNRILTPGVMGLDSLYLFIQTLVVYILGANTLALMSKTTDYLLSVGIMAGFSLLLYRFMFRREHTHLFQIILIGMVFGILFNSLATFMQVLIDPNEFLVVQARSFASFNNVNTKLLGISALLAVGSGAAGLSHLKKLDVMSLGREIAINLGVDYDREARNCMILVSILIAVSTALVGPISFLGLLVANLARQLFQTYRHDLLIPGAMLLSLIALIGGQFLVERVYSFSTPISVLINFIGGIYFLFLLIKEGRV